MRYFQSKGFKKGVFFFTDRYAVSEVSVCLVELLKMNGGGAMGCERNLLVKSRWVSLKLWKQQSKEFHGSFNPFFPALSGTFSFRQHFTGANKKSGH